MPALTRGPLPPSVYWRRRLILLTVALIVLWLVVHLLTGGDSTPKAASAAHLADASSSTSPKPSVSPSTSPSTSSSTSPSTSPSAAPSESPSVAPIQSEAPTPSPTVKPTPTGACAPSDLSVTPSVTAAARGSDVPIVLTLQTFTTPACTWHVSPKTMQVKVSTAGGTDIWSTLDCPKALSDSEVVVYKDTPTQVTVTWSSRDSDSTCSTHTAWAKQGTYSVTGVALGGTPDQASFTLGPPVANPTAAPTVMPTGSPSAAASTQPASPPTTSAPATPSKKKHQKQPVAD